MHKKIVSLLISISCLAIISGCASSKSGGTSDQSEESANQTKLQKDLAKAPPEWSSSGDEDIDAIGEKVWNLVDGSHTRMNQVNTKLENHTEYMQFLRTLESRPGITADALLKEWKADTEGLAKQVPAVEAGSEAMANDLNAFEIFLKETLQLPEIVKIAANVESIKAKLDSANFLMKAKLGKAAINLPKGGAYIFHCNGVIKKLKSNNDALLSASKS